LEVKDFFDLYWSKKNLRWVDRYYDFLKTVNEHLFKRFLNTSRKRILLIGMGYTRDIEYFMKFKKEVITIDVSLKGLKGLTQFERVVMDANEMGFKKASFDVVFVRTVMLHLNHKKFLREIKRLVRKRGQFIWIEPMKNNFFLWFYRILISPGRLTKTNYLTFKEIMSMRTLFRSFYHEEYYFFTVGCQYVCMMIATVDSIWYRWVAHENTCQSDRSGSDT